MTMTFADLRGTCKVKPLVAARWELYYLLWKSLRSWSYPRIARLVHKDHTTVLNGVRNYCRKHGIPHERHLRLGIMIDVPAREMCNGG